MATTRSGKNLLGFEYFPLHSDGLCVFVCFSPQTNWPSFKTVLISHKTLEEARHFSDVNSTWNPDLF